MSDTVARRSHVVATAGMTLAAIFLGGCGTTSVSPASSASTDPSPSSTPTPSPFVAEESRYVIFPDKVPADGWSLSESVRLVGAGGRALREVEPHLDWYAEFSGPGADPKTQPTLMLGGYSVSLETMKELPESATAALSEGEIGGKGAFWGSSPESSPDEGSFVVFALDERYSIRLFARHLGLDELLGFANELRRATEAEWVAAGGEISTCLPMATDCK